MTMGTWAGAEIAGAVLNGIAEGLLLVALVWVMLRLLPRTAAATRYALWILALVFMAALPVIEGLAPGLAPSAAGTAAVHRAARLILPGGAWLTWALGAWALASAVLVARVGWSLWALGRLKRGATPAPASVRARFEELMRAVPGRRRASVLVCDEIQAPVAAGVVKPAVLLPAFLADELSEAELDQVLTHELAHLRRWDDWTNLAQKLIEALLFFHPAVLWIGRRLALEREIACDDWVVSMAGGARPYAACLTRLAAIRTVTPQLAPGTVGGKPQLSVRVEALVTGGRDRRRRFSKAAFGAALATLAAVAFVAAPFAPVVVALPAVPAPARPAVRATVPAIAYAAPKPPRVSAPPVRMARAPKAEAPMPVAVAPIAVPPGEAVLYVIYVNDGGSGWIRIVWVHALPSPTLGST
jgi:beta-lactamase regulating signal transducer with metallopeptidase domain